MPPQRKTDPKDVVFTPAQAGRLTNAYLQDRFEHKDDVGIPFGLPSIDAIMNPMLPGQLGIWLGRPGHGKTANLMRWARHRARWLQMNGMSNRVVVYATYEQPIEELSAFHVASEIGLSVSDMARGNITENDMEVIRMEGLKRSGLPLWFIGHSIERRKTRPRLDVETLDLALQAIEEWQEPGQKGITIDMVFVDYLQRIPFLGRAESKTIGTGEVLNAIKDMTLRYAAPVMVGVQAKREVDSYTVPVPTMADGQWTSEIEQTGDLVMSSVRPIKYVSKEGEPFGSIVVKGRNQMAISVLKQKMGDSNVSRWVEFDPAYNRLDEMEETVYDLNGRE